MAPIGSEVKEPGEVRRQLILELLRTEGYLRSVEVSRRFDVSEETARRDLAALDDLGRLRRVRGGAVALETEIHSEPPRPHREGTRATAKKEIASVVRSLLSDGDTVFFDVGTTVEAAAHALAADFHGRVITTSLTVGMILAGSSSIEVEMIGGRVRPHEYTVDGADALEALGAFTADVSIIGCGGVSVEEGVTDFNPGDIPLKRTMIRQSRRPYVLADATKLGKVAVRHVCQLAAVEAVITDSAADPDLLHEMRTAGTEVLHP